MFFWLIFSRKIFPEYFLWQPRDLKTEPSPPLWPWGLSPGEGGYQQGSWGPYPRGVAKGAEPTLSLCHFFSLIFITNAVPNNTIGSDTAIIISISILQR